jgi:hypothetical protein
VGEESLAAVTACGAENARRGLVVEALRTAVRRENILPTSMRQLLPASWTKDLEEKRKGQWSARGVRSLKSIGSEERSHNQ